VKVRNQWRRTRGAAVSRAEVVSHMPVITSLPLPLPNDFHNCRQRKQNGQVVNKLRYYE